MNRVVLPELLDELPASNPAAIRSRHDLRRVNWWMGNARIIAAELSALKFQTLLELGCGDGTVLLDVARILAPKRPPGTPVRAFLLDKEALVSQKTVDQFKDVDWTIFPIRSDLSVYLKAHSQIFDVLVANLILHHFKEPQLRELLQSISHATNRFVACEPRRRPFPWLATRLLWVIGCNHVTRNDATISVAAGFAGSELTALWPAAKEWTCSEANAGIFSHKFHASRESISR